MKRLFFRGRSRSDWLRWVVLLGFWGREVPAGEGALAAAAVPRVLEQASRLAVPAPVTTVLAPVNLGSREEARLLYLLAYETGRVPPPRWTGAYGTCDAGSTEPAYREQVLLRINYYRAMAGVPAEVRLLEPLNQKAQAAALLMSRNLTLSHTPSPEWPCYSAEAAEAAANSLLTLGRVGPEAVDLSMRDAGAINRAVAHRRWLVHPPTRDMGTGDVPGGGGYAPANAIWVIGEGATGPRPPTREAYVAWPPPGYVPYPVVFPRWSFGLPQADFTGTVITLHSNGVPVAVEIEPLEYGYGENTVVWHMAGADTASLDTWPRPGADTEFEVTLDPVVVSGVPHRFSYAVRVFDPALPGAEAALPAVTGPGLVAVGEAASFSFAPVPVVSGYDWTAGRRQGAVAPEGAEGGLGRLTARVSPGYDPVTAAVRASGERGFHLAHPVAQEDQTLTWHRPLWCTAASTLRFQEYLGIATSNQVGRVQVSLDDGATWGTVHARAGSNGDGVVAFRTTTVSLGAFAGRWVRVRFNYHHSGGSHYPQTDPPVGWFLDDIELREVEEIEPLGVQALAGATSFAFAPGVAGEYVLAARGRFQDRFALEWGPGLALRAEAGSGPGLAWVGLPMWKGGQVEIEFTVSAGLGLTTFQVLSGASPAGPWSLEPEATFSTVVAGQRYRVVCPGQGRPQAYYRLRGF